MQDFEFVVIGGGIVRLSVPWAIMEGTPSARFVVIKKESQWARHQGNSGVIYSGIYYKPGSLKAKLCREGNLRMVEFCREHGIRSRGCAEKSLSRPSKPRFVLLEKLFERGIANGLAATPTESRSQVHEFEPHVKCLSGIHVPSTGIVDFAGCLLEACGAD